MILFLSSDALESAKSNKPRRVFLPLWCRYIAWALSVIIILGCGALTVLYGIRYGVKLQDPGIHQGCENLMWQNSVRRENLCLGPFLISE